MENLITFENTIAVLKEYAAAAEELYKMKLLGSGRVASGELIDSVSTQVVVGQSVLAVEMHLSEFWKYVEWDTRPHWPPSGALLKWIEAKPVLPHPDKNGRLPTPKQLDYLIRRKIAAKGTKGSHDLANTVQELNRTYEGLIADAVVKDFGAVADTLIRTFARA